MESIYILGNSGFARETAMVALATGKYEVKAFVESDDFFNPNDNVASYVGYHTPIINESHFLNEICSQNSKVNAAIAIANGKICRKIFEKFREYCTFPNLIHPDAKVATDVQIGYGNILFAGAWLSCLIKIGSFNKFLNFTTVGHECVIGDYNEFNPKSSISGKITIGDDNLFGANSAVYQGLKIGSGNTIGLGAVVLRKVHNGETWLGNPAKKYLL